MWDQNFYFSSLCYEADRPLYRREKSITICTICSPDSGFDSLVELNIKHFFLLWSYFFLPICNFSKVHLLANHLGCLPCSSQTLPSLISTYTHPHTRGSPPTYVQFSPSVVSDSLQPHELQHARPPCPSQTPGVCSNSCPSSQ